MYLELHFLSVKLVQVTYPQRVFTVFMLYLGIMATKMDTMDTKCYIFVGLIYGNSNLLMLTCPMYEIHEFVRGCGVTYKNTCMLHV